MGITLIPSAASYPSVIPGGRVRRGCRFITTTPYNFSQTGVQHDRRNIIRTTRVTRVSSLPEKILDVRAPSATVSPCRVGNAKRRRSPRESATRPQSSGRLRDDRNSYGELGSHRPRLFALGTARKKEKKKKNVSSTRLRRGNRNETRKHDDTRGRAFYMNSRGNSRRVG